MSILRWKQKVMCADGGVLRDSGGGGGGSSGPTQSTTYNTNIPEYAKPYVETMLGATQQQLFDISDGQVTGFKPYTPYSTDVSAYVAPFSPMQQQAMRGTAGLQQPGQFGTATGMAGISGLGGLGIAGQAAGMGGQYEQMATTPSSIQAYMSPYMQNVVDYQKAQALRDYGIAAPMRKAQAVGQGAFGGTRQALMESEAQRNLMSQLQGIEATGAQQAFQNAQQAQQFRSNLGLQGYQTALGGLGQTLGAAGALGQLGTSQQAADLARLQAQQQMGSLQQQQEQQKINQAIQNYAIQQQYPLMQLGFMSNMLRGLPLQSQTTQLYQAQPTTTQQAVGLLGAGASLFGGRAAGGAIKEYREGGIASAGPGYKYGTLISSPKLEGMADNLSVAQLQERLKDPQLTDEERRIFQTALQEKLQEEARGTEARMAGIAAAGGPAFATQGMAGGGIVAFADTRPGTDTEMPIREKDDRLTKEEFEALVSRGRMPGVPVAQPSFEFPKSFAEARGMIVPKGKSYTPEQLDEIARGQGVFPEGSPALPGMPPAAETKVAEKKEDKGGAKEGTAPAAAPEVKLSKEKGPSTFSEFLAQRKAAGPEGQIGADFEKYLSERLGKSAERLSRDERMAMAKGFLKFASTPAPGGIMQAAAAGLGEYATGVEAARKTQDTMEAEAQKARMELDKARRAEARGDVAGAQEAYDKYQERLNNLERQRISSAAAFSASRAEQDYVRQLMTQGKSLEEALQIVKGAGRAESVEVQRAKAALEQINTALLYMKKDDPRRAELETQRAQILKMLMPGGGIGGGQAGTPPAGGSTVMRFDAQGNPIKG